VFRRPSVQPALAEFRATLICDDLDAVARG
jgi:hypothetical protein